MIIFFPPKFSRQLLHRKLVRIDIKCVQNRKSLLSVSMGCVSHPATRLYLLMGDIGKDNDYDKRKMNTKKREKKRRMRFFSPQKSASIPFPGSASRCHGDAWNRMRKNEKKFLAIILKVKGSSPIILSITILRSHSKFQNATGKELQWLGLPVAGMPRDFRWDTLSLFSSDGN